MFAANTAGSLLGALAGGLVLLPRLGIRDTFTVGIALNALAGAAVLVAVSAEHGLRRAFPPIALAAATVLASTLPGLERGAFTFQIFSAYSVTARSLENRPIAAMFTTARRAHSS